MNYSKSHSALNSKTEIRTKIVKTRSTERREVNINSTQTRLGERQGEMGNPLSSGAPAIRHGPIVSTRIVSPLQGESAVDIRVPPREPQGSSAAALPISRLPRSCGCPPGAAGFRGRGKHAFDLSDRRGDGSEHPRSTLSARA